MVNAMNTAHKEPSMVLTPSRKSSSFYIRSLMAMTCSINPVSSKASKHSASSSPPTRRNSDITSKTLEYSMNTSYTLPIRTKRIDGRNDHVKDESGEMENGYSDNRENCLEYRCSDDEILDLTDDSNPLSSLDCSQTVTMTPSTSVTSSHQADLSREGTKSSDEKGARNVDDNHQKEQHKRPPFCYNALIVMAFNSSPHRCLSSNKIFEYIMKNYPYYRENKHKWLRCVRRCLSSDKRFIKVTRHHTDPGRGNYWMLDESRESVFIKGPSGKWRSKPTAAPCNRCLAVYRMTQATAAYRATLIANNPHPYHTQPGLPSLDYPSHLYHPYNTTATAHLATVATATAAMLRNVSTVLSSNLPSEPASTTSTNIGFSIDRILAKNPKTYTRNTATGAMYPLTPSSNNSIFSI